MNWVDVRDVADLAAAIFAAPAEHQAKGYLLTGPEPVGWDHVTQALTAVTGRAIEYQAVSVLRYMLHLRTRQLPAGAIAVQTILRALLRYGQGAKYDPTLERLLGRLGRSVEQYIRDNANVWKVAGRP